MQPTTPLPPSPPPLPDGWSVAPPGPPAESGFDIWELRWIATHLPELDKLGVSAPLEPTVRVLNEHDVYLLSGSDRINLKIRHRENTFKLKRLYERTSDGLERWRVEFDTPLPAGTQVGQQVLDLLGRAGPAERLGAAATPAEAVEILDTICDRAQIVPVHKARQLFQRGTGILDDVRFRIDDGVYRSLGVESPSLSELRTLVADFTLARLGSPRNYAEFLHDLATGRGDPRR